MEYYAGLDVSMEETHLCVLDRDGTVIREGKTQSTPTAIEAFLATGPVCRQVVFETGRMAPMLYHGLTALGVPVVCIESRQAYQALKSLATHKTDRNDARGLAHLARTDINPARWITQAASPSAAMSACERFFMKQPTSC
jgi:transposase